ncbi:MAG TPA: molybdopterin-dependent oxidoreductase [Candidatus Krumholzibacteria bacterium]|nr:molybdopterin-dependent oxidoreductase [Candidatus Krumholzibacteria bacterium]HPD73189.1 molybdopterin-dependent oxidoreductase [Candidatus Krumholzibacteria bacterium]HRY41933.1 molybdopterin-dependent oxidoreductase [Candidatus Krumholzibacteria bacterium]
MSREDVYLHVRGESTFVDDLAAPAGQLFAAVLGSPVAHGTITRLDASGALQHSGVVRVLTAADIPGENQIGPILPDEPLLADGTVHHVGQPVAVVLAETLAAARRARRDIALEIDPLPPVLDARAAAARGQLLLPARTFALGDVDAAWSRCAQVVTGRADSGAQEHFYLETQGALAVPAENGTVVIHSSTQSPTGVQRQAARVLGVPMHAVEVDVRRLGGGFGGKEDQATPWAVICALGAALTGCAVRLVLDRRDDLVMTGKRHPYSSDFKLGLAEDGEFLAYEVVYYQNAGSAADLSPAILERSLFHATGSYAIANVRATALSCRTNLAPFTAFRGFGGPQAMFVLEAAIDAAARGMGVAARDLQRRNLLREGSVFPYGQTADECHAERCWNEADRAYDFAAIASAAAEHNRSHAGTKKGTAVMPVCFGISFTNPSLNQAGALVHVYADGSVGVATGAVEMGQGVNQKIRRIVAAALGVATARVRLDTTNTSRVANTSPTAASAGADLNGMATRLACLQIRGRLQQFAADRLGGAEPAQIGFADERVLLAGQSTPLDWPELIRSAQLARIDLSAHAHYATPRIAFDKTAEKGRPFAYHVYGTAITEVTLDCLRGTATIDAVRLVHDAGKSIDLATDRGQVEGALAQGLGWMLLEDVTWDEAGRLRQDTAGKYKVPDLGFVPPVLEVAFLEDADNPHAVLGSKGIGEPPLMYGIGAYFALRDALAAARGDLAADYTAPLTCERTLQLLAGRATGHATPNLEESPS